MTLLLLCPSLSAAANKRRLSKPAASKPLETETPILFAGLPAVIQLPGGNLTSLLWKTKDRKKCEHFTLLPYAGSLQAVRITASGVGSVDLSISNGHAATQISLAQVNPEGAVVNFCISEGLLQQPGSSAEGKLIAWAAGYKPTTAVVKVERPSLAPWLAALQWFFAILLPAFLAGVFGVTSAWLTSSFAQRREQKTAFRKLKDEKFDDLGNFFQTHLRNLIRECQSEQEFAERLRSELQSQGYWTSIPWKERDRIERFIKQHKVIRMRSTLAALFSEWEKDLSELHT